MHFLKFFVDDREKQQNDPTHKLQSPCDSARLQDLHWHVQGVRQTHEHDPGRLRGVPQDQTQELES